jgi:molybdopterin/thiamine biosynthesis adenylyltransferase
VAELLAYLQRQVQGDLLSWREQVAAAETFGVSLAEVERTALENDLLPARYQRNRQMISCRQQLQLFQSCAAVIGCGGLGGYVLEELARLGVGRIVAIDPDVFEEHNLNRQLLSLVENLGQPKVEAAAARIAKINPAIELQPVRAAFGSTNGAELLSGVDVVVDAVDNIPVRLELAEVCAKLGLSMVHGAIAGWYGHVATVYPGDATLEKMYPRWNGEKGVESHLGNPSFTPAVAASLQVAEAAKVLLGQGNTLRNRFLSINLLDMEIEEIPI